MSKPILYHYVHCPFCVRVRMALGFLKISYESKVLPYDDEKTPINLMGKKMLPIMQFSDKTISNESLDIIKKLDANNLLSNDFYISHQEEIESLLNEIGKDVHSMAMPYWIWTPEFTDASREYFQNKKEVKRGPFAQLVRNQDTYKQSLIKTLNLLENKLSPFYKSDSLTIVDILIASHLWGMFVVPEFQYSVKIYNYLMQVRKICHFNYHQDFWSKN